MATDGGERLERILALRREEEERARLREAQALRAAAAARSRLRLLEAQLRSCRDCRRPGPRGAAPLIDADRCAARLRASLNAQHAAIERAGAALTKARLALAQAARRRLAIERLLAARELTAHGRREALAQADLDDTARLRSLREGS